MSLYLVTGTRAYREHQPGSLFETNLEQGAEQRAIDRGDICVVEVGKPALREGSYRLPAGWDRRKHITQEG